MKGRALLIFFAGVILLWFMVGLFLIYGFAPVDFYGDGAYFAQATIRWVDYGWPTIPIAGQLGERFGWGFFTVWAYISLLRLVFHFLGTHPWAMRLISLVSVGTAMGLVGLLMARARRDRKGSPALFFLLMALSPLPLVVGHTERPEGLMALWITGSVALILLSRGSFFRNLGFFILPISFWIHQLGGVMALCLFLSMSLALPLRRSHGQQLIWLFLGGILVLLLSFLVSWYSGKVLFWGYVSSISEKGWGLVKILSSWHLMLAVVCVATFFLLWPLRKARLDLDKTLIALITVGLVLLPMVFGMRPRRVFQFVYPLLWFLLYIGFLYAEQLSRLFKYGFLSLVLAGMCFYWWRSKHALYITVKNPEYIRQAEAFMERNRPLIDSSEKVFMALHGEGYLFWLLPREKQKIVSPYFRGPLKEGDLVLITDYEIKGIPHLQPIDSLSLSFTYSFYGSRPFRKIYLCRGKGDYRRAGP